jgi:hypothetical protein
MHSHNINLTQYQYCFNQSPHCQILQKKKKEVEDCCKKRKIDYKFVKANADWTEDTYLKVSNQGTESFSKLSSSGLVDKILDQKLFEDLEEELKTKGCSDRGSVQRYAGYATMNQKFDDIHSITAPQMIVSMDEVYVEKMVDFTSLIKLFCQEFDLPMPYSDDSVRTEDWSQRLCSEYNVGGVNLIEQVTFALTCVDTSTGSPPIIFGAHVDHLNDPQWPEVFCIYKHYIKEGKLFRLAAIAYSRSIIRLYRFKDIAYECLKEKILAYLRSPTNQDRLQLSLKVCVPLDTSEYTQLNKIRYRKSIPFLDKAGFYSGFVDAILRIWDGESMERLCELLILVGWIPTASTYQMILTEWGRRDNPPPGVWTLAYIAEAVESYRGITTGPGHRCQPWMNRPLLMGNLVNGLTTLRSTLLGTVTSKEEIVYARVHQQIQEIGGIGPLGAQHIIGVASLLNAIHPRYQCVATIAQNTMTAKRVKKLYNLSAVVLEKQKQEVALATNLDEKIVESAYCEMFREEAPIAPGDVPTKIFDKEAHAMVITTRKANPTHPDVYFHGQVLRTVIQKVLVELYRDQETTEHTRILPYVPIQSSPTDLKRWKQLIATEKSREQVVYTSIKQTNVDPYGRVVKQRVRVRSAVIHSGFGIHDGLESRLKEKDLKRMGEEEYNSEDEEEHEAYISSITKKSILAVRLAGATRILRSATNRRFPPTEMIAASNKEEGTYKIFDIKQRVALILNNFVTTHQNKYVYEYSEIDDLEHIRGYISFTAVIKWQANIRYRPARIGKNAFWEVGYVGEKQGIPYYSTKTNARRAVSLRILVDYFAYQLEKNQGSLPPNHHWPKTLMNQTTKGDNFVVLAENVGGENDDDHLFSIIVKHGDVCTLLIPRDSDHKPWKEVEFRGSNWSKKRPASG